MPFYAVANGRTIGLFSTWKECQSSVIGFPNARFKKFETREEAEQFIHPELVTKKEVTKKENETDYFVYTDGGCSNNGKRNAVAGIGLFFGVGDPRNVSRRIQGKQTNNTAELTAILEAYPLIEPDIVLDKHITIVSDSEYAIRCVTSYGEKCEKQGWPEIPNRELVKRVYELYKDTSVQFMHVDAHTNRMDPHSVGNRHADALATRALDVGSSR
jgi:ribonuclease HI